MKFIGIDLGWSSGASGLCSLQWHNNQLEILNLDRQNSIPEILTWIDTWVSSTEPAIIAVDAPTLIPNLTGMRLPDRLTHQHFGRYHAGCYPANLSRPYAQKTVEFGLSLEARGFEHAPTLEAQKFGRYQIEVFPHPATINLFQLERILKYKKGKLAERQLELLKLRQYLTKILPTLQPSLTLSSSELIHNFEIPHTLATFKALEDKLDSLICAYIAAHWWYWGLEKNLVLGDRTTGYIVIPKP
ncbi:MAG: DUF429 domain-containing protein [Actinomycetota bacterium]